MGKEGRKVMYTSLAVVDVVGAPKDIDIPPRDRSLSGYSALQLTCRSTHCTGLVKSALGSPRGMAALAPKSMEAHPFEACACCSVDGRLRAGQPQRERER